MHLWVSTWYTIDILNLSFQKRTYYMYFRIFTAQVPSIINISHLSIIYFDLLLLCCCFIYTDKCFLYLTCMLTNQGMNELQDINKKKCALNFKLYLMLLIGFLSLTYHYHSVLHITIWFLYYISIFLHSISTYTGHPVYIRHYVEVAADIRKY